MGAPHELGGKGLQDRGSLYQRSTCADIKLIQVNSSRFHGWGGVARRPFNFRWKHRAPQSSAGTRLKVSNGMCRFHHHRKRPPPHFLAVAAQFQGLLPASHLFQQLFQLKKLLRNSQLLQQKLCSRIRHWGLRTNFLLWGCSTYQANPLHTGAPVCRWRAIGGEAAAGQ